MLKATYRFIKNFIFICWLIGVFILGAWIAFENTVPMSLNILGFQFPEWSSGTYMCWIFVIGGVIGYFTHLILVQGRHFAHRRELSRTKKEMRKLQEGRA